MGPPRLLFSWPGRANGPSSPLVLLARSGPVALLASCLLGRNRPRGAHALRQIRDEAGHRGDRPRARPSVIVERIAHGTDERRPHHDAVGGPADVARLAR